MGLVNSINAFNKAGGRLLQKTTRTPLEEKVFVMGGETINVGKKLFHGIIPPKIASTASYVYGERAFGKEGFEIVSFFDDSGKLIQRHRLSTTPTQTQTKPHLDSITDYSYSREHGDLNRDDLFFTHTQSFQNNRLISDNFTSLTLDYTKPVGTMGTKTSCTLNKGSDVIFDNVGRNMDIPATKHLADRFDVKIETIGHHRSKKSYEQKTLYSPSTGIFTRIYGKGKNLTSEELQLLNSDRYLPLRFHHKINRYDYLVKDACAKQGAPLDTPLTYTRIESIWPGASTNGHSINIEYLGNSWKGARIDDAVNFLNHEAKHIYQFRLVADLESGKITDPILRRQAETYKYEFNNYCNANKDYARYRNQVVEKEAFEVGEKAGKEQYLFRRNLQKVFPDLSINITGC